MAYPADPDKGDDPPVGTSPQSPPGTPLWVKVFGIIAAIFVLVFVVLLLVGGNHGPGRHSSGGDGAAPLARVTADLAPPSGVGHGGQQS